MQRTSKIALSAVIGLSLLTTAAIAANLQFKGNEDLVFEVVNNQLFATGSLSGLGNQRLVITLAAEGLIEGTCTNPGTGEQRPPGQNPSSFTVTGEQLILPENFDQNGNVTFEVNTADPTNISAREAGCPNNRWDWEATSVDFTAATLTIRQGNSSLVCNVDFDPSLSNGDTFTIDPDDCN
jgi:hypothetical protein